MIVMTIVIVIETVIAIAVAIVVVLVAAVDDVGVAALVVASAIATNNCC